MDQNLTDQNNQMASIGRQFNAQFVEALGDELRNNVFVWLQSNGIPAIILEALGVADTLADQAHAVATGKIEDTTAQNLPAVIAEATNLVWILGGQFSAGGMIVQGENQVDWPWRAYSVDMASAAAAAKDNQQ